MTSDHPKLTCPPLEPICLAKFAVMVASGSDPITGLDFSVRQFVRVERLSIQREAHAPYPRRDCSGAFAHRVCGQQSGGRWGRRRRIERWRQWRAYWRSGRWDGWCCGCRWADWRRSGRNYRRRYETRLVLLLAQAPSPLRTLLNALSHRSRVKIAPELTRYRAISTMSAIGTKQTLAIAPHMSAFGGRADRPLTLQNVKATDRSYADARGRPTVGLGTTSLRTS
jgi:hypothetical protein